jgi:hypothetical protein
VVYDSALEQAHLKAILDKEGPGAKPTRQARRKAKERVEKAEEPAESKEAVAELPTTDSYLSKIAKYVPAETITATLAAFAAFEPDGNTIWIFLGLGAVANVVYLLGVAMNAPVTQRPRVYFYLLSVVAFFGWSIAVVEVVQTEFGITGDNAESQTAFVLVATAFLVPALDNILSKLDINFGG